MLWCSLYSAQALAQDRRSDGLPVGRDTLNVAGSGPFLVHVYMIPGSETVWIDGVRLDRTVYSFDYTSGRVTLLQVDPDASHQLVVSYRYLPIKLPGVFQKWTYERPPGTRTRRPRKLRSIPNAAGSSLVLTRSGSITRGITTGSNRDVGIESGLRLQVEGEILEGVRLRANLTDENTPVLPEGTTQRLNEFDRIFIELSASGARLQLGDIDGSIQGGQFAQFRRKLQGVMLQAQTDGTPGSAFGGGSFVVSGATSRGLFRVQEIVPVEGVQGPYRLEGNNGERFVIVLPGSERVYMDGQRIPRGKSNGYVIDYTTGELTFSPSLIVSPDRRISVEFEYTTNQFTRTILATDAVVKFGQKPGSHTPRFWLGITAIREADGDRFSDEFGLTGADSLALQSSGDGLAFRTGSVEVLYDPEALFTQYVIVRPDSVLAGDTVIFRAVTEQPPDTVRVFRVTFSRTGVGKGSYVRAGQRINGIVYEYAGPGRGEYEPIRLIPAPQLHELLDFRGALNPLGPVSFSGEWATSRLDKNRLSSLDAADDIGTAYTFKFAVNPIGLSLGDSSPGWIRGQYERRRRTESFTTFDRIRTIEFARDWNIRNREVDPVGGIVGAGTETQERMMVQYLMADSSRARLRVSKLNVGDRFSGRRLETDVRVRAAKLPELDYRFERIQSEDSNTDETGTWIRYLGRLAKTLNGSGIRPFVELEHENLKQRNAVTQILIAPSIRFTEARAGVAWTRNRVTLRSQMERRTESRILTTGARQPFRAWTFESDLTYSPRSSFRTETQIGYRNARTRVPVGTGQTSESGGIQSVSGIGTGSGSGTGAERPNGLSEESLILRWSGRWRPKPGRMTMSWLYQAQTERSATLQEIYLRTGQDRGEFIWVDENGDGVIQLEEFIPETTPEEGNYVRSFIPSDSLEAVTSVKGRLRIEYRPGAAKQRPSGALRSILNGLGSTTLIDIQEKSRDPDRSNIYLVRLNRFRNSLFTLNGRIRFRQELNLFRDRRGFDLGVVFQEVRSMTELAAGEETRFDRLEELRGRYRPASAWSLELTFSRNHRRDNSASFASRNFDIVTNLVSPRATWSVSRRWNFSFAPVYSQKREHLSNISARNLQLPVESRFRMKKKLDMLMRFEYANISVTERSAGLKGFELTDGRGAGGSMLWRLTLQSNLTDVLTAIFSYDGRAPSGAPVIHTARFQMSARF